MSALAPKSISPPPERIASELEDINCSVLKGSEPLRKLLRFLAEHSLNQGALPAKEQDIAVSVFGRRDFDSKIDSVVRVQTGRLRSKLAEYYMGEGLASDIVLEIPKGSYSLAAHYRSLPVVEAEPAIIPGTPAVLPRPVKSRKWLWIPLGLLAALAIAALVVRSLPSRNSAVETFWRPFLDHSTDALVVFANPRFVGQSITGLKLYDPAADHPAWINETYSGTGEVFAVHALTLTLTQLHKPLTLRRARVLIWDEAKSRDLIFLGAPNHNSPLSVLQLKHFALQNRKGYTVIANLHPSPEEPEVFAGDGPPVTIDYAVLAQVPSVDPTRRAIILAGTTTHGTQAAAEFICREDSVAELLSKLGVPRGGTMPPFEALVQVRVRDGVALQSQLIAVRKGQ